MPHDKWQEEMVATTGLVTRAMAIGVRNGLSREAVVIAVLMSLITECRVEGLNFDALLLEVKKVTKGH